MSSGLDLVRADGRGGGGGGQVKAPAQGDMPGWQRNRWPAVSLIGQRREQRGPKGRPADAYISRALRARLTAWPLGRFTLGSRGWCRCFTFWNKFDWFRRTNVVAFKRRAASGEFNESAALLIQLEAEILQGSEWKYETDTKKK